MFTGLIEATGRLGARERRGPGFRLDVHAALGPLELGESISVNGACLTVAEVGDGSFAADISLETAERTTLGRVPLGAALNLERSLSLGAPLGGHLVSGHVDAVVRVQATEPAGEALRVRVELPREQHRLVAEKGSVVLDGVSLTVNAVFGDAFEVMLIPHTLRVTNLGEVRAGRELNFEADLIARYVARWLETREAP
jgi:riboflavin synthase